MMSEASGNRRRASKGKSNRVASIWLVSSTETLSTKSKVSPTGSSSRIAAARLRIRGSSSASEPWAQAIVQLQGLGRLAGLVVYGSPYLWQSLQAVLDPRIPAAYSPGQMPQAQTLALQSLGLGRGVGETEAGTEASQGFTD